MAGISKTELSAISVLGVQVSLDGDGGLRIGAPIGVLTNAIRERLRLNKADVIELLRRDKLKPVVMPVPMVAETVTTTVVEPVPTILEPEDLDERFQERAAIIKFCGGLERSEAEPLARLDVGQTAPSKTQNVLPEPEEMPDGIRCPFCDHRFYADDPAGCRCCGCGRLCWVKIPNGGICRADLVGMAL